MAPQASKRKRRKLPKRKRNTQERERERRSQAANERGETRKGRSMAPTRQLKRLLAGALLHISSRRRSHLPPDVCSHLLAVSILCASKSSISRPPPSSAVSCSWSGVVSP